MSSLAFELLVSNDTPVPKCEEFLKTEEHWSFFYKGFSRALHSLYNKEYRLFDGHTTTNCCHGMGIFVAELIQEASNFDFNELQEEYKKNIDRGLVRSLDWIPESLLHLLGVYFLHFIVENEESKGARTDARKLGEIHPVSRNYFVKLINHLQKHYSNVVARRYQFFQEGRPDFRLNGVPLAKWQKHVSSVSIRRDKYGSEYVSNLYSMQVSLAHLILSEATIAIVNDLRCDDGALIERFVFFLKGDGKKGFIRVAEELLDEKQAVITFSGSTHRERATCRGHIARISPWLERFEALVLACDVFYPHFPGVKTDPNFDSSPIFSQDALVQDVLGQFSKIEGVSADDPSLFCLTHIYTASVAELLESEPLPEAFIPEK